MAKSAIEVRGLSGLQRFMLNLVPQTKREIKQLAEGTGRLIEVEAKSRVSVNTGKLRQSISYEPIQGGLGAQVSAFESYWAYVEFGTGGLVDVPEGFEDLAAAYQGSGKRQINLPPRPFLIPAWLKYKDKFYQGVEDALDRIFR